MDNVTIKNTKKEIWDAYRRLIKQMHGENNKRESRKRIESEEKAVKRVDDFSVEKVVKNISDLKSSVGSALNKLSDRLVEEMEKLSDIRKAVAAEKNKLEQLYKIKYEAETLVKLLEA